MARSTTSSRCNCRHVDDEDLLPIAGSGSATDPYVHQVTRFVCVKDPNNNDITLTINENGCVTLPRTLRSVILPSTGETIKPNALGHIAWPELMKEFSVQATAPNDPTFTRVSSTISSASNTLTVLSSETNESGIVTLQNNVTLSGTTLRVPFLRTETHAITQINYPFSDVSASGFDKRVELWPGEKVLAIDRQTTAICHVKFNLRFDPDPAGGYNGAAHAVFDLLDASGAVVHQGYYTPTVPEVRSYSYFFPLQFNAPSMASENGKVEFRISYFNQMPNTSSMTINDILVSYTLM